MTYEYSWHVSQMRATLRYIPVKSISPILESRATLVWKSFAAWERLYQHSTVYRCRVHRSGWYLVELFEHSAPFWFFCIHLPLATSAGLYTYVTTTTSCIDSRCLLLWGRLLCCSRSSSLGSCRATAMCHADGRFGTRSLAVSCICTILKCIDVPSRQGSSLQYRDEEPCLRLVFGLCISGTPRTSLCKNLYSKLCWHTVVRRWRNSRNFDLAVIQFLLSGRIGRGVSQQPRVLLRTMFVCVFLFSPFRVLPWTKLRRTALIAFLRWQSLFFMRWKDGGSCYCVFGPAESQHLQGLKLL